MTERRLKLRPPTKEEAADVIASMGGVRDVPRAMQCKDIPDAPLLAHVGQKRAEKGWDINRWDDFAGTQWADLPEKLSLAKMGKLIKRGLLDGCACGCRGGFELTAKGRDYLEWDAAMERLADEAPLPAGTNLDELYGVPKAYVNRDTDGFLAWCSFHEEGVRHKTIARAADWAVQHNLDFHRICEVCCVDHSTTMADLSHGIIYLIQHAQERMPWMEFPVNGDMIARQRAGIVGTSLLYSTTDPEDIDWERVAKQRG